MKKDAHFYAVLAFCRRCGFKKEIAFEIAYASQFVDDAKIDHIVMEECPVGTDYRIIDNQTCYYNMATSHGYFDIKTLHYDSMINNTTAFHFVPGCVGQNFSKKMRCSEDSPVIKRIIEDVIDESDPIVLGVVLHAYADTFSHQGFSGIISKVNDIKNVKAHSRTRLSFKDIKLLLVNWARMKSKVFDRWLDRLMPAYGHGQALDYSDIPHLKWSYEYDYSDEFSNEFMSTGIIDNPERFSACFQAMVPILQEYLQKHPEFIDQQFQFDRFEALFELLKSDEKDKRRIQIWEKGLIDLGLFERTDPQLYYSEELWLQKAFKNYSRPAFSQRKVVGAISCDHFADCEWYRFFKATKWYKEKFFNYCSLEGLDIPR